jgi:hypothetical protein
MRRRIAVAIAGLAVLVGVILGLPARHPGPVAAASVEAAVTAATPGDAEILDRIKKSARETANSNLWINQRLGHVRALLILVLAVLTIGLVVSVAGLPAVAAGWSRRIAESKGPGKTVRSSLGNGALIVVGTAIGLLAGEIGYRAYVFTHIEEFVPSQKTADPSPRFTFGSYPALWAFDREVGWTFRPGGYISGDIDDGRFVRCSRFDPTNERGHIGSVETDWAGAGVRGALVGSSYTMGSDRKEPLFHEILGEVLGKALGKNVLVENFSMDSYGVAQMVEMAAVVARRHRPDFIVIAFNSATLAMNRHWRLLKPAGDGFYDFYMIPHPDMQDPSPFTAQLHEYVISDRLTDQWCARMTAYAKAGNETALRNDPLVGALVARHQVNHRRRHSPTLTVGFWSLEASFAYLRVAHGNPFWNLSIFAVPENPNPVRPLAIDDYGEDGRFLDSVRALKESGVPFYVVHIPSFPEIESGDEWAAAGSVGVAADQERALAASLPARIGQPVLSLLPSIGAPRADADRLAVKARDPAKDWHPNPRGVALFVSAVADILLEQHFARPIR